MDIMVKEVGLDEFHRIFTRWLNTFSSNGGLVCIFGGERQCVINSALVACVDGRAVGMVSLSLEGESGQGPQVVGIFVEREYRRLKIGSSLLGSAVAWFNLHGVGFGSGGKVHIEALTKSLSACIGNLPFELLDQLEVRELDGEGVDNLFP